ncbi:50S ribosomal protein L18 [Candidatus Bathyarchaeota archaeon]|nr:50S ribosomal protein L18 [Candidatus Bathyarchaeota archaeon]
MVRASGPRFRVPFRRRLEGKTNYYLRRRLISSKKPRLVIRGSLKHITVAVVEAKSDGDYTLACAHSSELAKKVGWLGGCGNLPAAYLTGLLAGYRAVLKGIKDAVLDIGLHFPSKGARVFAALRGALDAGLHVPHGNSVLPDDKRISGEHIAEYARKISSDLDLYRKRFSSYLARNQKPEELPEHFNMVRKRVIELFGTGGARVGD